MKKILVLIVATAFILSVTSFCLAAYEFYRGTITKISGNKATVKDDMGKLRTISINDGGITKINVGDKVSVENGKIIMYKYGEDGVNRTPQGSDKTDLSPNLNPQPEPPAPGVSRTYPK